MEILDTLECQYGCFYLNQRGGLYVQSSQAEVQKLIELAEKAMSMLIIILAMKYRDGDGVKQDGPEVVKWFEKAVK